ncbi:MAG TPA: LemA family protein [Novosphingobium sp.]
MSAATEQTFAEATDLAGRSIRATNFLLDNWWLWLLLAVAVWLFLRLRKQHELLSQLDERCEATFADIDALLTERNALIGNLVETVKGFAGQEHKVLKDVIDARAAAMASVGRAHLQGETQIGQSVNSLFAISENYPELASSAHFQGLRAEMTRMEDRITAARRFYNLSVEELNAVRRSFPGNLIDRFTPFGRHDKFSLGEKREAFAEPIKVSF